jgi:hypothetical protein
MRDRHTIDIHNYKRRLELAINFLNAHPRVSDHNKPGYPFWDDGDKCPSRGFRLQATNEPI